MWRMKGYVEFTNVQNTVIAELRHPSGARAQVMVLCTAPVQLSLCAPDGSSFPRFP